MNYQEVSQRRSIIISQAIIIVVNFLLLLFTMIYFIVIEFSDNQMHAFFSTIATITASLFGLTTASYIFYKGRQSSKIQHRKKLFHWFVIIAVNGSITISLSITTLLLNGNPIHRPILLFAILLFFVELTLIFCISVEMLHQEI